MTKLAPEWVRISDPVIRSPARLPLDYGARRETCWGKDNRHQVGLGEESGIRSWDRQITGIRELPGARRLLRSSQPSHGRTGCADRKVGCPVGKTGVGNLPTLRSGKSCRQLRSTGWVFGSVGQHWQWTAPPVRNSLKWE